MDLAWIFIIALGLSMDAFAIAIYKGLSLKEVTFGSAAIVGLYFGIFQAVMPLIGYYAASSIAGSTSSFEWIAFALLCFLGVRMIIGSFRDGSECKDKSGSLRPAQMLPLAVAVSIDALAVGVSFAFLDVNIFSAVTVIGVTALVMAMIGVRIGRIFGKKIGSRAELVGGMILVLIGLKILLEGQGII